MTTQKYENCSLAKHLVDDLWFCRYSGKCNYKVSLGKGKNHSFCIARLEGFKINKLETTISDYDVHGGQR